MMVMPINNLLHKPNFPVTVNHLQATMCSIKLNRII